MTRLPLVSAYDFATFSGLGTLVSGTAVLTITSVTVGALVVGMAVTGTNIPAGATISSFGSGTGGTGTYNLSANATGTVTTPEKILATTDGTNVSALNASADWVEQNGVSGQLRVISNLFHNAFATMADCSYKGATSGSVAFTANQYAEVTLAGTFGSGNNDTIGINLLDNGGAAGAFSAYRIYVSDTSVQTVKCDRIINGTVVSVQSLSSATFGTWAVGNKLSCEVTVSGGTPTFQVYRDTGSGPVAYGSSFTDTAGGLQLTTGKPGICGSQSSDVSRGGPWSAGNLVQSITPSAGTLALTGNAPTVASSGGTNLTPSAGTLTFAGHAAALLLASLTNPPAGAVAFTGHAPTIAVSGSQSLQPTAGTLAFTGAAPTVSQSGSATITPSAGTLSFTGSQAVQTLTLPPPPSGTLSFTGAAPTVSASANVTLTGLTGVLAFTGYAPVINGNITLTGTAGTLAFSGHAPSLLTPLSLTPSAGSLALTGHAPSVAATANVALVPLAGSLTFSGAAPTLTGPVAASPGSGSVSFRGYAPTVQGPIGEQPAGRKKRTTLYRVVIDGEEFWCSSVAEAVELLQRAKALAQKVAREAEQAQNPPALAAPQIEVEAPELKQAAQSVRREIEVVYEQALVTAEIRLLMELSRRKAEEDDIALMFFM